MWQQEESNKMLQRTHALLFIRADAVLRQWGISVSNRRRLSGIPRHGRLHQDANSKGGYIQYIKL
jgi:hypothetical protein